MSKLTKIRVVFIHLSSPPQKGLLHLATPQKSSIILFSCLSVRLPYNLNTAFLIPGKVSSCTVVKSNPLHHSMLILALRIQAERWASS